MTLPRELSLAAKVMDRALAEGGVVLDADPLVDRKVSLLAEILLLLTPDFTLDFVGWAAPLDRLRFLITSVFRLRGRTTPCSFRKSPQALQRGWPSGFLLQSGVVVVLQLVQRVVPVGCPVILAILSWLDDSRFAKVEPSCPVGSVISRMELSGEKAPELC